MILGLLQYQLQTHNAMLSTLLDGAMIIHPCASSNAHVHPVVNALHTQAVDKFRRLICQHGPDKVHVVDLSTAGIDCLEQLIHLLIAHLLAQIRQDISQLTHANEAGHIFVEYLEAAAVFFRLARVSESAGSVEDFAERLEVD